MTLILTSAVLCSCSTYNPPTPSPAPVISQPASPTPTTTPSRAPIFIQPPSPTPPTEPVPSTFEAPAATWGNLGPADIGDTIETVSAKFGLEFGPVEWLNSTEDCGITQAEGIDIALVVAKPGGVQAFVVADPRIPLVIGNQPIHVGDSLSEAAAAFPNWYGSDSYESLAGGPRGVVAPRELNQNGYSRGRAILFEADPDEIIQQYRVGVTAYSTHVDYCTSPD